MQKFNSAATYYQKLILLSSVAGISLCFCTVGRLSFAQHQRVSAHHRNTRNNVERRLKFSKQLAKLSSSDIENSNLAKSLLSSGADPNALDENERTPLMNASEKGHWRTVELLVKFGANVNSSTPFGDEHYYTPLMNCATGPQRILKVLLSRGAKVNASGYHEYTALMVASNANKKDNVKLLIRYGANVNAKDRDGHTSLDCAEEGHYQEIVHILKAHGAK